MKSVNSTLQSALATKTYTNVISMNAYSSSNNISGGNPGNNIAGDGTTYQYARTIVNTENGKVLMFTFIGEDNNGLYPAGSIARYQYDIQSNAWSAEHPIIFNAASWLPAPSPYADWIVHDHEAYKVGNKLRIYFSANDRANLAVSNSADYMIESTDGLVGRTWTAPVEVIPWHTNGVPTHGASLISSGTPGISWLMVVGDTTSIACFAMEVNDATGLPTGVRRTVIGSAGFTVGEGDFVRIDANRVIGVIRNNGGSGLYMVTTTDNFATPGNLVLMRDASLNTIGAATGAKVTPKINLCANNPSSVVAYFTDIGDGNRTKMVKATVTNAFANVWDSTAYLGTIANQGNSAMHAIDIANSTYLCVSSLQKTNASGIPSANYTDIIWWLWKDLYTKSISPAPWK